MRTALSSVTPLDPFRGLAAGRGGLLGVGVEGLGNDGNAGTELNGKSLRMCLLSNSSCLILDSFVQPESWLPDGTGKTELGNEPSGLLPVSLK